MVLRSVKSLIQQTHETCYESPIILNGSTGLRRIECEQQRSASFPPTIRTNPLKDCLWNSSLEERWIKRKARRLFWLSLIWGISLHCLNLLLSCYIFAWSRFESDSIRDFWLQWLNFICSFISDLSCIHIIKNHLMRKRLSLWSFEDTELQERNSRTRVSSTLDWFSNLCYVIMR